MLFDKCKQSKTCAMLKHSSQGRFAVSHASLSTILSGVIALASVQMVAARQMRLSMHVFK